MADTPAIAAVRAKAKQLIQEGAYTDAIRLAVGANQANQPLKITYGNKGKVVLNDQKKIPAGRMSAIIANKVVEAALTSPTPSASISASRPNVLIQVSNDGVLTDIVRQEKNGDITINESIGTLARNAPATETANERQVLQPSPEKISARETERERQASEPEMVAAASSTVEAVSNKSVLANIDPKIVKTAIELYVRDSGSNRQTPTATKAGVQTAIVRTGNAVESVQQELEVPSPEAKVTLASIKTDLHRLKELIAAAPDKLFDKGIELTTKASSKVGDISATVSNTVAGQGNKLIQLGQRVVDAAGEIRAKGNWASQRIAMVTHNRAATAISEAFSKGKARAPNQSEFKIGDYTVQSRSQDGKERFVVKAGGHPILLYALDEKGKPTNIKKGKGYDYQDLKTVVRETPVVKSVSKDYEAKHTEASRLVANMARLALKTSNGEHQRGDIHQIKGKTIDITLDKDGSLRILSSQDKKVLLTQAPEGKISSNLAPADFKKFQPAVKQYQADQGMTAEPEKAATVGGR